MTHVASTGQFDTRLISRRDQLNHWMVTLPGHGLGKLDNGIDRIEQGTIPMVFKGAPTAFNGVLFPVLSNAS
jgi:hypothetical protein